MDNFNSLGRALALSGVCSTASAAERRAAWQTRPQVRRGLAAWHAIMWAAEVRVGHGSLKRAASRKVKVKPQRRNWS